MNDPDPMLAWPNGVGNGLPERLWGYEDLAAVGDRSAADMSGGLVSLAFITAALKRRAWLWCLTALLGLLVGSALYMKDPPAYHATAEVLLVDSPNQNPAYEVQTDQTMAESGAVAALVVQQLRLPQSVSSFQAASTVTIVTPQVLMFNVGAPSASDATARVTALVTNFLTYRADYAQAQLQPQLTALDQQFSQAQQRLDSINAQISQIPSPPSSAAQRSELARLQTQVGQQLQIEQYVTSTKASDQTATYAMLHGSRMLGAAIPIPRSRVKGVGLYVAGGLFGGLVVGMAIVIISALMSDRLRRRDDVAEALGAPVRLSVGTLRSGRLPGLPGRASKRDRDMKRVVAYLRGAVPSSSSGAAGLVVVAVDNAQEVAPAVVSLAASCASDGRQIVVADLAGGALAALIGAKGPGVHAVSVKGTRMTAMVPDRDDVAPVGPLQTRTQHNPASEALLAACASADLLLSLASLDPAFGGDHLATWATEAVAVATAGRSSAERIHSVGEMIRLAGTRLGSVVLTGADKSDKSVGARLLPDQSTQVKFG